MPTGADFGYSVYLYYKRAPRYLDANTGGEEAAFSAYKNITVKVKPPQGVVLVGAGSADSEGYYTVHTIAEQRVQSDGNLRIPFTARMTGNGTTPGNQPYSGFDVKVEATVDTFNDGSTGEPLTFASTYHAGVSVTNTASNTWGVQKQFVNAEQTTADGTPTVTLTWTVKAGKMSGETLFDNNTSYNVPGTLNFKSYKFTDTLPVIESVEGKEYAPLSATISADGKVQATTGQGVTTISTDFVKTTSLTEGGVDTTTPFYTVYTITATYAREAFVTPYEKNDQDVDFTNGAKIEYTLVNGTFNDPDASAPGEYSIDTPAGSLKIEEYIKLGSAEETPYDAILAQALPGPATFNVYKLTGADDTKGTLVNTNAPIEIRGGSDPTHTLTDLAPGWYRVEQVNRPSGTGEAADVTVEVKSGETATAPFVNPVPGQGVLKIKKENESGAALAGAKFTLTNKDDATKTYTLTTLADGVAVLALPEGTYTMRETVAPNGYVLSTQTWSIEITEGKTNETYFTTPIVNIANTGTLTIHKKLTDGVDTKDPSEAKLGSPFSFTIERYTMVGGEKQYDNDYDGSATIAANANSTTVSGLAKADANGNYYTYEVTETAGSDAWLTYDTSTQTADFNSATTDVDEAVTFTNTVKSTLTISKTLKDIDNPNGTPMQATFKVYKGSASGTHVATITTDASTGKGTAVDPVTKETIYLPIAEDGVKINYYIVETKAEGYDVTYPADNDSDNASWQVNLAFGKANELSTAVINTKKEAQITITKQDNDNKAVSGATFAVKNSDGQYLVASKDGKTYTTTENIADATKFPTGTNGSVAVKYLLLDTYTIVETSVPVGLLSTGSVSGEGVNSVDTETVNGETALAGSIALNASLQSAAITFKNDVEPRFNVTKSVKTTAGTAASVSGTFTFELYEDANGAPGEAVKDAADNAISVSVTLNSASSATSAAVTVPGGDGKTYWLKETSWPNAVMDPALTAVEGDTTKVVNGAVYTRIELEKNKTATATIANTINGGTVTITKIDSKTKNADGTAKVLKGAKFQLQVSGVTDARAQAQLTALGFTGEDGTYTSKELTTDENGRIEVSGLPVYNGTTLLTYSAKETAAPSGYVAVPADAQFTALPPFAKDDNGNWATAETFENDPLATLTGEKTWYKQWETDSQNPITYKLAGVNLAVFEVGEDGALAYVQTVTTDANGAYTVENLNGTKEYVVFELKGNANKNLEGDPKGTAGTAFAARVADIENLTKDEALGDYYGVAINLAEEPDNAGEVDLVNVEPYVQLTLYKWYYPEDEDGKDIEPKEKTALDRAKFVLCRTTGGASLTSKVDFNEGKFNKADLIAALQSADVLVSEYVYESGMSDMLPTGYLVTGPLPRTDDKGNDYTYYFVEIESPSGYVDPAWPTNISEGITPEPGETNVLTSMANDPEQGTGPIRYVQVEIDKRVKDEKGETRPLSNATFSLYLVLKGEDAEKHGELYHISTFTSGVDTTKPIPGVEGKPEGAYDPGRGISESFALNELWKDFDDSVTLVGGEYTADFVLIETEWPGNTTPTQYRYNFTITTNGDHDALENDNATLYNYFTIEGDNPIVNLETEQVTVVFKKIGYEANATAAEETYPLAGAQISIYENKDRTGEPVAMGTTNANGEVTFTLSYGTTFYWKETGIPAGYEAVAPGANRFATGMNADYSFTTPQYSSSLTQPDEGGETSLSEPIVTVENVRYRKLALTKKDASGAYVAATFELRKNGSAVTLYTLQNGQIVEDGTSVTTNDDGTAVEVYVPAGTYTLVETKLGEHVLTETEQTYFNWRNSEGANAVTITLTGNIAEETKNLVNPGKGELHVQKTFAGVAPTANGEVEFELYFKPFATYQEANTATRPTSMDGFTRFNEATEYKTDATGKLTESDLTPGWYMLREVSGENNKNYMLAPDTVVKVTANNFGEGGVTEDLPAPIDNVPKGTLTIEKTFDDAPVGADIPATVTFTVTNTVTEDKQTVPVNLTNGSGSAAVQLDPGTYTVKEEETGSSYAWYTSYAVDYADASVANVPTTWPEASAQGSGNWSAEVNVTSGGTSTVTFTNRWNTFAVQVEKVDDGQPAKSVTGAKFALYYTANGVNMYWTDSGWKQSSTAPAAPFKAGKNEGEYILENVKLPYAAFSDSSFASKYYVLETEAPAGYTKDETPHEIAIDVSKGVNMDLTGDNAIRNATAIDITLTKYNRPYDLRQSEDCDPLANATFQLYKVTQDESGNVTVSEKVGEPQTTNPQGQIAFENLPKLSGNEYYAVQETAVEGNGYALELATVYEGSTLLNAVNGSSLFVIAKQTEDSDLTAYNTPYGRIAVLKYDYVDKITLPLSATFTVTKDGEEVTSAATATATAADPDTLTEGNNTYKKDGTYYKLNGTRYAVGFTSQTLLPGTYTVTEDKEASGYIFTPSAESDDPWYPTRTVTVESDGSTAVVVFANVPNPTVEGVALEKTAEYLGADTGLQSAVESEYQTIEFTLGGFASEAAILPLTSVVLEDKDISFLAGDDGTVLAETQVDWYVDSVTVSAAAYKETQYSGAASTNSIAATVSGWDGENENWVEIDTMTVDTDKTFSAKQEQGFHGIKVEYNNVGGAGLDAGFTAGNVTFTIKARQNEGENITPATRVHNEAKVALTYNFTVVGATAEAEATATASATVTIPDTTDLPRVSIDKKAEVRDAFGEAIEGGKTSAAPGDTIRYTITVTGVKGEMEDPIIADVVPSQLEVLSVEKAAAPGGLAMGKPTITGDGKVTVPFMGTLEAGKTIELTIDCRVLPEALLAENKTVTNTAYVFNEHTTFKNSANHNGSSFADANGNPPAVDVTDIFGNTDAGETLFGISDFVSTTVQFPEDTTISKMVRTADEYGVMSAWSSAGIARTVADGRIDYNVSFVNGATAIRNLWIVDVIPAPDDDRNSSWRPTPSGTVTTTGTVYYTTQAITDELALAPRQNNPTAEPDTSTWTQSSTLPANATAILVVFDEVAAGSEAAFQYSCTAPTAQEAEAPNANIYYYMAVNDASYNYGLSQVLNSNPVSVTLTPDPVSLGNYAWVDMNGNGQQDAGEPALPGVRFNLEIRSYNGANYTASYENATTNDEGIYGFDGLFPARPLRDTANYKDGDVDASSLTGNARYTYQLSVATPSGYALTEPYALNAGAVPTVDSSLERGTDSNFDAQGDSEVFYLKANTNDDTYDAGFIRQRTLNISKAGTNGKALEGAQFSVYGPYFNVEEGGNIAVESSKFVATLPTGEDGNVTFSGLNAYAYYVVVETQGVTHYDADHITATNAAAGITASGNGIKSDAEGQNYFVIAPYEHTNDLDKGSVTLNVTVTNPYESTGTLTLGGTKTLVAAGETLQNYQFQFTIRPDADNDYLPLTDAERTVSNVNGKFAFEPIEYTYANVQELEGRESDDQVYTYWVEEVVPEDTDGIAYDAAKYRIDVSLADDDGDGEITVTPTITKYVNDQLVASGIGVSELDFTNRSTGGLSIQKIVVGDDDSTPKSFRFTLTLKDAEGKPLTDKPFQQNNGAIDFVEEHPGIYTFYLKDKDEVTLTGLPVGATYTVTEDSYAQDGFTTTVTGDATGTITRNEESEVVFTNTRHLGGLTVTKKIDGNGKDEEKDFKFTVTLEHDTLPLNNYYGVQFSNVALEEGEIGYKATATFTLKGGETKALTGIPAGTKYTVTEQDYTAEGYVTDTPTNATGEITHGGNPTVTFKNTRKVGGLTVSKTVTGNDSDANKAFDITVTLTAPAGVNLVGSYKGAQSGNINVPATSAGASWTKTFSLKNGESINFTGLPEKTAYEVSEADYAAEGYVKTVSGTESGSITEATATVAYTNTRDTGDLVITKTVTGSGREVNRKFDFTLTLTKNEHGANVDGTYDTTLTTTTEAGTTTEDGTLTVSGGTAEFKLKHGQTITIKGLPDGTGYEVTEIVPTADGYTVAKTGDAGTIDKDTPAAATFTNTRNIGGFTVTKVEEGNGFEEGYPNTQDAYDITVTLTPPAGVTLVGYVNGTALSAAGTVTEGVWSKTLNLKAGESAVFTDLPEDTTYTISEADYTNLGYEEAQLTSTGTVTSGTTDDGLKCITGTIPGEEGANSVAVTVTVTNERNVGSLSVEKIVAGTGVEPEKDFTFTLQLTNNGVKLDGDYPATINGTATDDVEVDEDGTATFTLKGGDTITIDGIPEGTTYKVTEAPYASEGYETESDYKDATRTIGDGTTDEVTFTNTRNVGGFTLTKKTDGNGLDEPNVRTEFDITVTLTAPTGVQLVGTVDGKDLTEVAAIENGVWEHTFTLENGEKVVFAKLPEGARYTIVEANDGYASEGFIDMLDDPGNGVITVAENAIEAPDVAVTLTNIRNVGGLTIVKKVTGSGSATNDTFTFRLKLENENGVNVNGEYYMLRTGESAELLPVANGEAVITLRGNQSAFIDGIPLGTKYTVTERATDMEGNNVDAQQGVAYANGFALTSENGLSGTITSEVGSYVAEFTNHRDVGSLKITKNVEGNGEDAPNALTEFDVTVALTAPTGVALMGTWTQGGESGNVSASNTFTLTDGESVELTGLPAGTSYTITEESYAANGYESDIEPEEGEITDGATAVTVTNTMNVGDLSVTKTVNGSGAETDREFEFTLTLDNADGVIVDNTYTTSEGTITVENGKATFTLKDGETLTVYGIPEGTDYTVTEADYSANGYETTSTGDSSEIVVGETAKAEFTNHRDVGSLKITKNVEGNGEDAPNALTEFDVTVALTAPTGVTLTGTWTQGEKNGNVSASNTFTLTDGESVTLTGLPTGTAYTITEESYAANGYESDIEPEEGEITDGATAVTVTNTMNVGDLSVTKTVNGSGAETDREFSFTLTLDNADGVIVDNTYETSAGTLTVTGGEATFTLKGGETLTIYGIPEGTDYTVTEVDPAGHGYLITAVSGEEGVISTGTSSASFTNTRDIGELSVEKTVAGAIGETDKAFAFTLKLIPSGNGIDVDGVYNATLYTADAAQSTTVTVANGVANFTLTHDQRLVIHEIPAGATYEVTEASYALEGYQTEASGERGTIPAMGVMPVASFTNTRDAGSLRIEKVFAGNGPIAGDAFTFTIRLSRTDGVDVNGVYAALLNGEATQVAFTGGAATVALTGGDALEILDILSGTAYEVSEEIPDGSGYTGTSENETGIIPVGATAATTFTNERNVGNLIVRKAVAGNAAETDRNFDFTIFLREPDGTNANGSYRMTGDAGSSITFVNGYASLSLAAGEEAVIQGILDGAYYDVREDDADTDGYVTTSSATAGLISAADDALVSFLNTRNVTAEVTSRTVYKVWNDENDADGLRPDELIVYLLADGDSVAAAELNEVNGWSAVFDDLPVYNADGSRIDYEVVEAYTAEYYVRYQYTEAAINITNTHNPDDFTPRTPDDPALLTLIEDNMVPLGGNINMNEGDCFN